jgi:hypothetical protein
MRSRRSDAVELLGDAPVATPVLGGQTAESDDRLTRRRIPQKSSRKMLRDRRQSSRRLAGTPVAFKSIKKCWVALEE